MIHEGQATDLRYLQKKPPSARKCECHAKLGVQEPGANERVWIEATRPRLEITAEARMELLHLAATAERADDLCSAFFVVFAEGYQQAIGAEPSYALRWFATHIERMRAMSVHCSSSVMATLLRELAKPEP